MAYFDKYGVEFSDDRKTLVKCPKVFKGEYIIPNSVTSIERYAFYYCISLTSVTIGNSVTSIGYAAFAGCTGLTSMTIPNSVTSIESEAFEECSSLTSVTIGNSVTSIGNYTFSGCSGLTTINVSNDNPNYIAKDGVLFNKQLTTLIQYPAGKQGAYAIPNSVTSIGESAFSGCAGLTSITIPNSVTSIEDGAFWDCSGLTSVTIPNSVNSIGESAFYGCSALTSVTIPNSVTSIGGRAFWGCSGLTSVTIPNSVTSIGVDAFSSCSGLTSVTIGNSVTSIGDYAFSVCSGLTSVTIGNSVTSIGKYAFYGCSGLTSVTIPNSVTSIERYAFYYCISLTSVTIGNSVTSIGDRAFLGCSSLTSVTIPNSVTSIGVDAFWNCSSLTSVTIGNSVTSIGKYAFYSCSGLTSVKIPSSVTSIGEWAFSDCSSLTSVTIPNSVTSIGDYAFSGCSSLTSLSVEAGNTVYDSRNNCNAIIKTSTNTLIVGCQNTTIPNSVTSIGNSAFSYCTGLTSVTIPNGVTSIGSSAFFKCTGLTSVTIGNSVTCIGNYAFDGCSGLKEIIVPRGQKARFEQMGGLKDLKDKIVERDNEELTILLNLAKAYESGIGVSQNMAQSVLFYTQAAEKGCAEAAYRLAEWYGIGEVLPLDLNKALNLYRQASKTGYKDAEEKSKCIQQRIDKENQKQADYFAGERQTQEKPYYLFFDTETTGLPPKGMYNASPTCTDIWPRMVQLAWIVTNQEGKILKRRSEIIYPDGFTIPQEATDVHGITTERAKREGKPLREVLNNFVKDLANAKQIVCHNVEFDQHIVGAELYRMDMDYQALMDKPSICTMLSSTNFCAIPNPNGYDDYKWPKLSELYNTLFDKDFEDAHDALADITATKDCFFELKRRGII